MPFDGNPKDYQTQHDVLSLEGLIAWLEQQDPETEYDWPDCQDCLMGHYIADVRNTDKPEYEERYANAFPSLEAYHFVGGSWPWTYSAALARARALLAEREPV